MVWSILFFVIFIDSLVGGYEYVGFLDVRGVKRGSYMFLNIRFVRDGVDFIVCFKVLFSRGGGRERVFSGVWFI